MILALLLAFSWRAGAAETLTLPLLPPSTAPVTVPLAVQRLEAFDRSMTSLSADFRQFVTWEDANAAQEVDGHVDYRKPEFLRIEQTTPESQTIVGDGTWLWVYRPATSQVIQTKMEDWKRSQPLAQGLLDFGAYAQMLKRYDVEISSISALPDGHSRLELTLKPRAGSEPSDMVLKLRMTTRDFFPADTELRVGTVVARSHFSNIRYNPAIPASRFEFKPPAGADVFKNFKPPKPE